MLQAKKEEEKLTREGFLTVDECFKALKAPSRMESR